MSGDPGSAGVAAPPIDVVRAGHDASLSDLARFTEALQAAAAGRGAPGDASSPVLEGVMTTLERIDGSAADLARVANAATQSGSEMTPGEMVMLTVRCHQFLFECQLTSNIANRASDGIQQLFRQQA
jgi:hypothetical protein